jgi:DNA-binding IclR family transcriptional regulator
MRQHEQALALTESPAPDGEAPAGTRSVQRTLVLLKELSSRGEFGWRLSDLARQVGLDRGTCHRMLACLIKEGFAARRDNDLKYYPGQLLFEMGLSMPPYEALRERVQPRLAELCQASGCIASFSLRSGSDVVCVFQHRGSLELSGMMIRAGTRRPMFSAVGGLAILQQLPAPEADRIVDENTRRELALRGARRLAALQRMRRRSDEAGFGFTIGDLAPGLRALAVPVYDANGEPFAALTLTGSDAVLPEPEVARCHALLLDAADRIAADAAACLRRPARGASH